MTEWNIHPIFVHFPVALLSAYSLMELVRFKFVIKQKYWFYVKAIFVIAGALATAPTLLAGDLAQSIVEKNNPSAHALIETHSTWAVVTTIIFGIIAFAYLVEWVRRDSSFFLKNKFLILVWQACLWAKNIIMNPFVVTPLALIGLISVTITGSLGGAIAYGPNSDPIVHFVYKLIFR